MQNADDVECPEALGLFIKYPVGNSEIDLGFDIVARIGDAQHQIALGADVGTAPYYFAELDDYVQFGANQVGVVAADNGYTNLGSVPLATDVHPGLGSFHLHADAGVTPNLAVNAGWPGERYDASGGVPGYVGAPHSRLVINGLDVKLRYLAVIETQ